jgi:hypothetical protein
VESRLKRLKRIAALYGVAERMHSVELQRAASAVRETELAIEAQRTVVRTAAFDGREALVMEDRIGWSFAEMQREIAKWKGERLEEIRLKREGLSRVARERHTTSRLKSEQMTQVVDGVTERVEMEAGRRAQSLTDDRFLSRKIWMQLQDDARQYSR